MNVGHNTSLDQYTRKSDNIVMEREEVVSIWTRFSWLRTGQRILSSHTVMKGRGFKATGEFSLK
jgi:hypothetical protein